MIPIEYVCFNSNNGYSIAARNYILALLQSDYNIKITPFDYPVSEKIAGSYFPILSPLYKNENNANIQIYHCIPDMQSRIKNKKKITIGFATFESTNPPLRWLEKLNRNNIVITPSKFNYDIFSEKLNVHVYHVPHCIDIKIFNKNIEPMYKYDKFTFLFIGTWRERKGINTLLSAWKDIKDAQLVIKTDKPLVAGKMIKDRKLDNIIISNEIFSDDKMANFIKSANCLVAPSLGEGFHYPGLQAMAVGVPIIITNYSGCQDYANKETAILLEPEGFTTIPCLDNIPQFRNSKWAYISPNQLKNKMLEAMGSKFLSNNEKYIEDNFSLAIINKKFEFLKEWI